MSFFPTLFPVGLAALPAIADQPPTLPGLLWIGNGYLETFQDIQNLSGLFWLLTLYQFSQGLLTSLWVFPPELPVVVKERGGGMYSLTAYYLSRSVSELQLEVPFVVLQVTIVYFMVVLRPQIAAYVLTLLAMILVSLTSQGIGQLIGIGVNSPKNVQLSSALTIQWTLMASGFLMVMPTWLVWTQYLSVIRFGYIALLFIQFQDNYYQVCPDNNIVEVNECQLVPWTVALGGPQQLRPRLWVDWLALGGFVIVSRLSCFFMLKYRAEGMFEAKRKP